MSDNAVFSVVVTEGVHDVVSIGKILRLKSFQEAKDIKEIPVFLESMIPKQYPFEGSQLSRRVPYPSFFFYKDYWILVSNAGGCQELMSNLKEILNTPHRKDIVDKLRGAAVLADADKMTAADRRTELQKQLADEFQSVDDFRFNPSTPTQITLYEADKPFDMYIFPDNKSAGTLERILLEGAQAEYPNLFQGASHYVAYAKGFPQGKALKNFDEEKAIVGAISSVLKPGRAPQASFNDDSWFSKDSLSTLSLHQSLAAFIDMIIKWAN